jgi:hypothetical protein
MTAVRIVNDCNPRALSVVGNLVFTLLGQHCRMATLRTITDLEGDLTALRAAADRAGTALACLFSCSDEFEAEVVRVRREQGAYRARNRKHPLRWAALIALLAVAFILL